MYISYNYKTKKCVLQEYSISNREQDEKQMGTLHQFGQFGFFHNNKNLSAHFASKSS